MILIPAGMFTMGNPVALPDDYWYPWAENELPAHPVTLSAFRLDLDETTVAEYAEFLTDAGGDVHRHALQPIVRDGEGPGATYRAAPDAARLPIAFVSWSSATAYCAWRGKRLPTEAEWERAARGAGGAVYPWGADRPDCSRAVAMTTANFCEWSPRPVGSRSPRGDSPAGVRDLIGNVAEWVADVYDRYGADPATDPVGPAHGPYRVVRGGGFHDAPKTLSATSRWGADPAGRSEGIGFRCAL